ncbi:MAG: TetR/AcrR family transcriptional regulator [Gemmatimonadaceae bacterium]|nr:TetR/AcrR family transcriptional regulator [Gemmatimonadaceae bacterium]
MHKTRLVSPTPPQQARSRETQEALLAAAEQVFAEVGIAQATVAEICERAGVAIGTFYGRFPDKDALVQAWYERLFKRGRLSFDRAFSDSMWEGRPADAVIRGWVQARVLHYRKHRRLLRAVLLYARSRPVSEPSPFAVPLFTPALQRLTALLLARPSHPSASADTAPRDLAAAIRLSVIVIESALQSVVLFQDHRSSELQLTDDQLVAELSTLVRAYLHL